MKVTMHTYTKSGNSLTLVHAKINLTAFCANQVGKFVRDYTDNCVCQLLVIWIKRKMCFKVLKVLDNT